MNDDQSPSSPRLELALVATDNNGNRPKSGGEWPAPHAPDFDPNERPTVSAGGRHDDVMRLSPALFTDSQHFKADMQALVSALNRELKRNRERIDLVAAQQMPIRTAAEASANAALSTAEGLRGMVRDLPLLLAAQTDTIDTRMDARLASGFAKVDARLSTLESTHSTRLVALSALVTHRADGLQAQILDVYETVGALAREIGLNIKTLKKHAARITWLQGGKYAAASFGGGAVVVALQHLLK